MNNLINSDTDVSANLVVIWCTTDTYNLTTECHGNKI
jgi:hypothetical protein